MCVCNKGSTGEASQRIEFWNWKYAMSSVCHDITEQHNASCSIVCAWCILRDLGFPLGIRTVNCKEVPDDSKIPHRAVSGSFLLHSLPGG